MDSKEYFEEQNERIDTIVEELRECISDKGYTAIDVLAGVTIFHRIISKEVIPMDNEKGYSIRSC